MTSSSALERGAFPTGPGSIFIMTLQDLSPPAKVHYLYLLPYSEIKWSRRELGERLGFFKEVVHRALAELETAELLTYVEAPRPGRVTPFHLQRGAEPTGWQVRRRKLPTALLDTRPSTKVAYLYLCGIKTARTTDEVATVLGMSYPSVYQALRQLEDKGIATHKGENPQRFTRS